MFKLLLVVFFATLAAASALQLTPPGGFYADAQQVTVDVAPGHYALYTLDETNPANGTLVNGTVNVTARNETPSNRSQNNESTIFSFYTPARTDKATVLRVVEFDETNKVVATQDATYFIGWNASNFTVPVFSVVVDPAWLDSYEKGILIKGQTYYDYQATHPTANPTSPFHPANWNNDDLRAPAHYEIYKDGVLEIQDTILFYPSGQWSAGLRQKSFKLAYNKDVGKSKTSYQFFGTESLASTVKIRLRTGSQDWDSGVMMRDCVTALLYKGTNMEVMNCRPAVLFLNGEFWGVYNLREDIDDKYYAAKYTINKDDVVIITKDGDLDTGVAGDNAPYIALRNWLMNTSLDNQTNYDLFASQVNIDGLIDYYTCHMYANNADFPGDHLLWRNKNPASQVPGTPADGRWQYFCKDLDQGYGLYNRNDYTTNTLNDFLTTKHNGWPTLFLRKAFENPGFRDKFFARSDELLATRLAPNHTTNVTATYALAKQPEMAREVQRWGKPSSVGSWNNDVLRFENWMVLRNQYYSTYLHQLQASWNGTNQTNQSTNQTNQTNQTIPTNTTNSTNQTNQTVCVKGIAAVPVTCTGGTIVLDQVSGVCRTISCSNGVDTLKVLACDKPSGNIQYFEMYKQQAGAMSQQICLSTTCIGYYSGFKKSPLYPFCAQTTCVASKEICDGKDNDCDSIIDEGDVCAPVCVATTEVCDGKDNDCNGQIDENNVCTVQSASLTVKQWYPKGRDYVFVCTATGFTPTSYVWRFGDGSQQRTSGNDVYHTYVNAGAYSVSCDAVSAAVTKTGLLSITVS